MIRWEDCIMHLGFFLKPGIILAHTRGAAWAAHLDWKISLIFEESLVAQALRRECIFALSNCRPRTSLLHFDLAWLLLASGLKFQLEPWNFTHHLARTATGEIVIKSLAMPRASAIYTGRTLIALQFTAAVQQRTRSCYKHACCALRISLNEITRIANFLLLLIMKFYWKWSTKSLKIIIFCF